MEIANPDTRSRFPNRVTGTPDPFDGARHVAAEDRGVGFDVDVGVLDLPIGGVGGNGAVADQDLVGVGTGRVMTASGDLGEGVIAAWLVIWDDVSSREISCTC